jgi:hypothetical protein
MFPCLIAVGDRLLRATKKDASRVWVKGHLEGNRFLLRYGASERLKVSFIIDRTGGFRQVRVLGLRRRWAKPIAWLYDFVLSECEIEPGERLASAELLERTRGLKGNPPFRIAAQLQKFLVRHAGDDPFDESRFRQFWEEHGYPLPPSEWTEQYPPAR